MNKRIVFRHMEHSEPMAQHIDQQLAKIEEFLKHEATPILIDLVMEPSKVHEHHRIEITIKTPSYDVFANREYSGEDFYKELDHVIDIAYRQLHEQKRRNHDDKLRDGQAFKKAIKE